jgi:hypothetical protein
VDRRGSARPTVVEGDADTFGRLAESPVACPDANLVGKPSRCEELGVDTTNADTGEFVPVDELDDFSWHGDSCRWQLPDVVLLHDLPAGQSDLGWDRAGRVGVGNMGG